MKSTFLVLFVALLSHNIYAQKKGYEELQIASKLHGIRRYLDQYKLSADPVDKNKWLIIGNSLTIFSMNIDHFEVVVDEKDVIKRIRGYAKDTVFHSYDEWLSKLNYMMRCIDAEVGKINSGNVARESSKEMRFAWSFHDTKTALLLSVSKVDKNASFFRSNFIVDWVEDEHNMADVKF